MRVISKKISYNDLWSKVPGIIPSIVDVWTVSSLYTPCSVGSLENRKFYNYNEAIETLKNYNLSEDYLVHSTEFITYDMDSLREYDNGNYHFIPSDIIIPDDIAKNVTDYTDLYVNIPDNNGGFYNLFDEKSDYHYKFVNGRNVIYDEKNKKELKILTNATFTKWWIFFLKYDKLLFNAEYKRHYKNAVEYYNETAEPVLKNELVEYEAMDELFEARGGYDMFNWMKENCVISFVFDDVDKDLFSGWTTSSLSYPEVVKWYDWFTKRHKKYGDFENAESCPDAEDCCDCNEYFRLGGNDFYEKISEWLDELDKKLKNNSSTQFTLSASVNIPLSLNASIDDLGEMSIFSTEWEEWDNYKINGGMFMESGTGTVVYRPHEYDENGKITYLEGSYASIIATDTINNTLNCFHENSFDKNDWVDYTSLYISENKNEFTIEKENNPSAYTFSPINGEISYVNADFKGIKKEYDIIQKNFILINGEIHDVINGKYVTLCNPSDYENSIGNMDFKRGIKLPIYERNGLQYCIYRNKKYYVERTDTNKEVIRFFKDSSCFDVGCTVSDGRYVYYNGVVYVSDDGGSTVKIYDESILSTDGDIFTYEYHVLNGYADVEGEIIYLYGSTPVLNDGSGTEVVFGKNTDKGPCIENDVPNGEIIGYIYNYIPLNEDTKKKHGWQEVEYDAVNSKMVVDFFYEEIRCDIISGYTESRLETLRRKQINTDDLGNELPGYFNYAELNGSYNTIYEGAVLDILYEKGTVANLSTTNNDDVFFGDIIEKISLYCVDDNGDVVGDYLYSVEPDIHIEKAIEQMDLDIINNFGGNITNIEDLKTNEERPSHVFTVMMNVDYRISCEIEYNGSGKYEPKKGGFAGISRTDTLTVKKTVGKYWTNENDFFSFTYYMLSPFINTVEDEDIGGKYIMFDSYFEMKLPIIKETFDGVTEQYTEYNGMVVLPVLRTEWDLFSSTPKKVSNEIYIDRGINSAFEKHFKLQEVRTIDALVNYGIKYFKIQ